MSGPKGGIMNQKMGVKRPPRPPYNEKTKTEGYLMIGSGDKYPSAPGGDD